MNKNQLTNYLMLINETFSLVQSSHQPVPTNNLYHISTIILIAPTICTYLLLQTFT